MIHYPNIPINHHTVRQEYKKFFSYWNWELFITLSFHHRVDFATAIKDTKTWLKDYRHKMRGIKFAGIIQVVHYIGDSPHVHVLLTSDPAYPRTLKDLDSDKSFSPLNLMVSSWELSKKGTCKIIKVYDNAGISNYLAKAKNLPTWDSDRGHIDCYRLNLLNKLKRDNLKSP